MPIRTPDNYPVETMKRSFINREISSAIVFFESMQFKLPLWGYWTSEDWNLNKLDDSDIRVNQLGWDLTDFGTEAFASCGLILFTMRNGKAGKDGKSYCEKIMIAGENQVTPRHYHSRKMEDIINRGGGVLIIELFESGSKQGDEKLPVNIKIDGLLHRVEEGEKIRLLPGQSICLPPYLGHRFYGEEGKGRVLIGEVSAVNDDQNVNLFFDDVGRFPAIEEDEPIRYLLVSDYDDHG